MNATHDLALMRATLQLEDDPAVAAQAAGTVLGEDPANEAAGLLLAEASRRLGDAGRALGLLEVLVQAHPESAPLRLEVGRAHAAAGRHAESAVAFEAAVSRDPSLGTAWNLLSTQRLALGELAQADAAYLAYRRLCRDPPDLGEAYAAFDQGYLEAAQVAVQKRLRAGTNEVAAFTLLAAIASRRGDEFAEEGSLLEILRLAPCDHSARERRARLLLRQGRIEEAQLEIERLLAGNPASRPALLLKIEALNLLQRHAAGLALIEQLIAGDPGNAELWLAAGNVRRFLGQTQASLDAYRRALAERPGYGAVYLALSNLKTTRFSDDDVATMQRVLEQSTDSEAAVDLGFALGKGLEERGRYADSFRHYALANARVRERFEYDAAAMQAYVRRFKATFTREFFAARAGWGASSEAPIFIVGLPRSGSTLIEQILASHSSVEGTRELSYLPAIARELAGAPERMARYPEQIAHLTRTDVEALAARYLTSTETHRILGRAHFIDKMHGNFQSIGLLHLMFPRASIIDSRRHPMATGFAIYKQLFNPGMNFAYDLRELGLYYRCYVDLMAHVDSVLPGRVHRLQYERLVDDIDPAVRQLLEHCRLPFEAQCLRFYETRRVAHTISSEQVRQPIYRDAVEHWRHYAAWLGPLADALGEPQDANPA